MKTVIVLLVWLKIMAQIKKNWLFKIGIIRGVATIYWDCTLLVKRRQLWKKISSSLSFSLSLLLQLHIVSNTYLSSSDCSTVNSLVFDGVCLLTTKISGAPAEVWRFLRLNNPPTCGSSIIGAINWNKQFPECSNRTIDRYTDSR